jgi:CDP-paratose 2-epimerase
VRDNIHAIDVAKFIAAFAANPRAGEVYNLGGGRSNSCSVLEAFDLVEQFSGNKMRYEYQDANRTGDHICYISNLAKARAHYPDWRVTISLPAIFEEIATAWRARSAA